MQHSITYIAKTYSKISELRKDKNRFIEKDFFEFTKTNAKKYHLIESGDDLLVSSWDSNDLIEDYRKTL